MRETYEAMHHEIEADNNRRFLDAIVKRFGLTAVERRQFIDGCSWLQDAAADNVIQGPW